jgi:hypothetical protein
VSDAGAVACGEFGTWRPVIDDGVALSDGPSNGLCALQRSGSVACWDENFRDDYPPIAIANLADATQIAGTSFFACALRKTGAVACWGQRDYLGSKYDAPPAADIKL